MSLDTKFYMQLIANYQSAATDFTTATALANYAKLIPLATGTAANQADKYWSDQRTIAASSNDDLDLAGSLTELITGTLTFVRVKGIIVYASTANTNNVIIGGSASNPLINWVTGTNPAVVVRPGGLFCLIAPDATGYAVTAGTGDILRLSNSGAGTTVTYDIHLIGASA
jgi:hypothetical protein